MKLIKKAFNLTNKIRIVFINSIFWLTIIILALVLFFSGEESVKSSTLLIQPVGDIYDSPINSDFEDFILNNGEIVKNTLLREILSSIKYSIEDKSIDRIILDLDFLGYIGHGSIVEIGSLLEEAREAGKTLISYSTFYSQESYYLASFTDYIYMDPFGEVYFNGLGLFRSYYKDLLDKYDVDVNIFRAGEYKSFVEPYLGNSMTDTTKEQNLVWMESIWGSLLDKISVNRATGRDNLLELFNNKEFYLEASGGSFAKMALDNGLVDELSTPKNFYDGVGESYHFYDYLKDKQSLPIGNRIAVVTIEGAITYSDNSPGSVSAIDTVSLLETIEADSDYSALILRINSGGGGVYASEIIRRKVEAISELIPVVISMGDVCASGGYWIATAGDYILADNTTITGSIGVFGINLGFEDSLKNNLGVHSDGVGTMYNSGDNSIFRNLSKKSAKEFQLSVDQTYREFLKIVSTNRNIQVDDVEKIAGGRVWSGSQALEHGLVDSLGGILDSINYLSENHNIKGNLEFIDGETSLLQDMLGFISSGATLEGFILNSVPREITKDIELLNRIDDPKGLYSIWY